jgi:hypothetical protein
MHDSVVIYTHNLEENIYYLALIMKVHAISMGRIKNRITSHNYDVYACMLV